MSNETCKTCRFWEQFESESWGECRRFPPTLAERSCENRFPQTAVDVGCGEWRPQGQLSSEETSNLEELGHKFARALNNISAEMKFNDFAAALIKELKS